MDSACSFLKHTWFLCTESLIHTPDSTDKRPTSGPKQIRRRQILNISRPSKQDYEKIWKVIQCIVWTRDSQNSIIQARPEKQYQLHKPNRQRSTVVFGPTPAGPIGPTLLYSHLTGMKNYCSSQAVDHANLIRGMKRHQTSRRRQMSRRRIITSLSDPLIRLVSHFKKRLKFHRR